jgi:hypothetical protein
VRNVALPVVMQAFKLYSLPVPRAVAGAPTSLELAADS